MPYSARTALGSDMKRAFKASSFQHAANRDASWFFCSVIGLSFFETAVSKSWLDSSSQQVSSGGSLRAQANGTSSIVPRRRPLIRQKRRQCSRMGSTSQGERKVVPGTDCHRRVNAARRRRSRPRSDQARLPPSSQRSEETAEPSPQRSSQTATVEGAPPRYGDLTAENHFGRCGVGLSSRIGRLASRDESLHDGGDWPSARPRGVSDSRGPSAIAQTPLKKQDAPEPFPAKGAS